MIDIHSEDISKELKTLQKELKQYNQDLIKKPSVLLITKSDTEDPSTPNDSIPKNIEIIKISSLNNINIAEAIDIMYKKLES